MGNKKINLCSAAYEFYGIQALKFYAASADPWRASHTRFVDDLNEYEQAFTTGLANAMHDYILLAAFGEARNASATCDMQIEGLSTGYTRVDMAKKAVKYSVASLRERLLELFDCHWHSAYGGKKWGDGVKALDIYYKTDLPGRETIFVDHAFDLQHNGGSLFNKTDYGVFNGTALGDLLETKRYALPNDLLKAVMASGSKSYTLYRFIERAMNIGLVPDLGVTDSELSYFKAWLSDVDEVVLKYRELGFGNLELPGLVVSDHWHEENDEHSCDCGSAHCEQCNPDGDFDCGNPHCDQCFPDGAPDGMKCDDYSCEDCYPDNSDENDTEESTVDDSTTFPDGSPKCGNPDCSVCYPNGVKQAKKVKKNTPKAVKNNGQAQDEAAWQGTYAGESTRSRGGSDESVELANTSA